MKCTSTPAIAKPTVQATPSVSLPTPLNLSHLRLSSKISIKMKGNEFSSRELNTDGVNRLKKLHQTLIVKEYGKGTIRNYCQEMTLLFKYYNDKPVSKITQTDIEQYLQYIKEVHQVGRAKCRSVAHPDSYRE